MDWIVLSIVIWTPIIIMEILDNSGEKKAKHWKEKYIESQEARIQESINRQAELKALIDQYSANSLVLQKDEILTKIDGKFVVKKVNMDKRIKDDNQIT